MSIEFRHFCWRRIVAFVCLLPALVAGGEGGLESILGSVEEDVRKWATVIRVSDPGSDPTFQTYHLGDSRDSVAFWPASTIKLYTVIAVLEWMNRKGFPLDSTFTFSRIKKGGTGDWVMDCSRTYPEMVSEVFRRSSNEDYTLLLRAIGIDAINRDFLIPEKGFPHSALMRDYVTYRPIVYENREPQRVRVTRPDGRSHVFEHQWSGISYAEQRGATALSSTTGNCTSTAELANCLRRLLFHDSIGEHERFELTSAQAKWICEGDPERGVVGLENRFAGPYGWEKSGELVYPEARFFHKAGLISSYCLDVCYLSDSRSDTHLILSLAARSGDEEVIRKMAHAIYRAARDGRI